MLVETRKGLTMTNASNIAQTPADGNQLVRAIQYGYQELKTDLWWILRNGKAEGQDIYNLVLDRLCAQHGFLGYRFHFEQPRFR
jgi:hypothetical protein